MLSPFPGMDPYLEAPEIWSDFHTSFYVEVKKALNQVLPPGYVARIDRYIWVHEPTAEERILLGNPDTYISGEQKDAPAGDGKVGLITAPETIVLPSIRHEGNRFLKIIDPRKQRVVTVFEVLSPANKALGEDRDAYLLKRNEYFAAGVNVVELDLLRAGQRLPWGPKAPAPADYYFLVSRASEYPRAGIWPLCVRDALPAIPIPLDAGVPEVQLDVQKCFNETFTGARFLGEINYAVPPKPPLDDLQAAWAHEMLVSKGIIQKAT